jgi:hypothetical protein
VELHYLNGKFSFGGGGGRCEFVKIPHLGSTFGSPKGPVKKAFRCSKPLLFRNKCSRQACINLKNENTLIHRKHTNGLRFIWKIPSLVQENSSWILNHEKLSTFIYCILASCYIRLTLNICSFVRQCNTFTSNIRKSTCRAHGWQHHIGENWHNRATTSGGEYSITTQDGHVRPKHVLIEFKKWMCYTDGQKNKYSAFYVHLKNFNR